MTFVPKNIANRDSQLANIQAKELNKFMMFCNLFTNNLMIIQNLKVDDLKEQLFVDLMQSLTFKLDQIKYPFCIFLFNNEDQYMFEYNWKNDIFYCQYDRVWSFFEAEYNMTYQDWQQYITFMIEKHFKFKPSTIRCHAIGGLDMIE